MKEPTGSGQRLAVVFSLKQFTASSMISIKREERCAFICVLIEINKGSRNTFSKERRFFTCFSKGRYSM